MGHWNRHHWMPENVAVQIFGCLDLRQLVGKALPGASTLLLFWTNSR
ncbi:hypothetical protein [Flaviflagellibacter deserti]